MTAAEILSSVSKFGSEVEFAYEEFNRKDITELVGEYSVVARKGGTDEGTEWWRVFYFKEHETYIKYDGYYTSYDGVTDMDVYEVFPKEVMVTVYDKKR